MCFVELQSDILTDIKVSQSRKYLILRLSKGRAKIIEPFLVGPLVSAQQHILDLGLFTSIDCIMMNSEILVG